MNNIILFRNKIKFNYRMFTRLYNKSELVIKNDLSSFLNASVSFSFLNSTGRLFHSLGPAHEKALRPYSYENFFSTSCNVLGFDMTIISFNDAGATHHTHLCAIKHSLNTIRSRIFSQCNSSNSGEIKALSYFDFPPTNLTAAF